MSTTDNDWERTSFDDEEQGFLDGNPSAKPEPPANARTEADMPAPVADVPTPAADMPTPVTGTSIPVAARYSTSSPQKQDREGRSALFWFGVLAAGVFLVAVIGGALYWLTQPSVEQQAFMQQPTEHVAPKPTPLDSASMVTVMDTSIKHDPKALAALFGDGVDTASRAADVVELTKPGVQPKANGKSTPKSAIKPKPKTEPPIASTPKPNSTPKPLVPVTKSNPPRTADPHVTPSTSKGEPVFVVQVFSSPSRDDADEWLLTLREKKVSGGYITEQKIKGESWYRVRFGEYGTRDAAESDALRLGFREPWVARIR